jgi:pyruvate dehydrogenase E2 component (dihydrolipoamide acetyltransferase)
MAYEFKLPDVGEGLTEGEIVRWLVKVGDRIEEGQIFVQVETDKAVVEIPSPKNGVILELRAKEGETVQVGQVIVVMGEPGERAAQRGKPERETKGEGERPSVGVVGELEEAPEERPEEREPERKEERPTGPGKQILAMPAVRKLAREMGVDLAVVEGSGPRDRVTEEDVRRAAAGEKKDVPVVKAVRKYDLYGFVERIPVRGMRKTIARAMVKSASTAAHVTAMDEADATRLVALREKEKEAASRKGVHLTYLPFVIKAVTAALQEHPYLNATWEDETEEILLKKYYNIGVAVDTRDGLMVPVVKNAQDKTIFQLARELTDLSDKARSRTIDLADLKGGTFTITNYGAVGGIWGTPIIHHPEVAILGLGKLWNKPEVTEKGVLLRAVLPLSLSFDHRVVDGAQAARFLNTVIRYLEDPELALMGG